MNVFVYDNNLSKIEQLHQWDTKRIIKITGLNISSAPSVLFYTNKSYTSYVVASTLLNGVVSARIPDALLQEGVSIVVCVMDSEAHDNISECETIASARIPVIPMPKH